MYNSIGGQVLSIYSGPQTNTCAVRLSKALNYSGVDIPHIPGKTFKGADNLYYFKAAYEINLWMRKTFGTNPATSSTPYNSNHIKYTGTQAGENGVNLPSLLSGKKGIYSLYSSNFQWATGHADILYSNSTCGNNCHFYDAPIARIDIWILN
ncbi:T6SS effector amidase Tae4 family protein [Flavobacterium suaedae]|nr:T6SS effector amidase Tae4 family protein [Flavobacterium suaedae]